MIKKVVKDLNWHILLFCVFFVYFYKLVFFRYAAEPLTHLQNSLLMPLMVAVMCLMLFTTNLVKEKLFWVFVGVSAILCCLCLLNNFGLFPHIFIVLFSTVGCFFIPYVVPRKYLEAFLKLFMASFVLLYFILGVLSIITVLKFYTGEEWAFGWLFRIKLWGGRLYINNHPNFTAISFLTAIFFCVFLLYSVKSKLTKILLGIALSVFIICCPLTNSRTAILAGCVGFGILAGSIFYQKAFNLILKKKIFGTILTTLFGAILVFAINSIVLSGFNYLGTSIANNQKQMISSNHNISSEVLSSSITQTNESQATNVALTDRDLIGDNLSETLNGRGYLWQGIFKLIENEPSILIKGLSPVVSSIMHEVLPFIPAEGEIFIRDFVHPHSGYFYILLAFGIPGLITVGFFIFLQLKNSIKLVFLNRNKSIFPVYLFPAFIAMLLSVEVVEFFIFNDGAFITPVFFLFAGCVCFYAKDKSVE